MLSAFHYSQSGVYELQLKNRYGYRNAWATICFATAVFSTLLLICTLLGLVLVYNNQKQGDSPREGLEDQHELDVSATFNRPNSQWILSGQVLNKIWFAQLDSVLYEREVSTRHPARRCSRTWILEVSDRCRHRGECTDDDLVYCRDRCPRARSYCSVFGRRYSDEWTRLVEGRRPPSRSTPAA
uniref:Conserved plasma membrane protein n=1 Tax=Steinernema glaseri TaxID=37863 RepID=A0A1I7YSP7_9BILA